MKRARLVVAAAALCALTPATAVGAGVQSAPYTSSKYEGSSGGTVLRADPGERNDVEVTIVAGTVVFRDRAGGLRHGSGCWQIAPDSAGCPGGDRPLRIDLGDGDDRLVSLEAYVTSDLGAGDDAFEGRGQVDGSDGSDRLVTTAGGRLVLAGGAGDDVLVGAQGPDYLWGGTGRDAIHGRGGNDSISAGGAAGDSDRIDGGTGRDEVYYAGSGVYVDLADPAPDGSPGENDVLTAIEDVRGTAGRDVLLGDGGANRLDGAEGDDATGDVIDGRGGGDHLVGNALSRMKGGPGADRIDGTPSTRMDGGTGDDELVVGAGNGLMGGTRVCGRGDDLVVLVTDAVSMPPAACEHVALGRERWAILDVAASRRSGGRTLRMRLGCRFRCRGTLVLGWAGERRRVRLDRGELRTLVARLPAGGRSGRLVLRMGPERWTLVLRSAV